MYSLVKKRNDEIIQVDQGDIYSDINFFKNIDIIDDELEIEECNFKKVLVLSQSCDLHREQENEDTEILTVLVVPLFEIETFKRGEHLINIGKKCNEVSKKLIDRYATGEHERYHVINIKQEDKIAFGIPDDYIIDFRFFFTADIKQFKKEKYVTSLEALFREKVTQRFSNYLSRIGLPMVVDEIK